MSHDLSLSTTSGSKEDQYRNLIPQLEALTEGEPDLIANLANMVAAIQQTFRFLWTGVYFVRGNELVLGPFQGPVACTRISYGKGVCGTSWKEKKTMLVPDVNAFPGHIACSAESKSEIVLPACRNNEVILVLDIDSEHPDHFKETDRHYLEKIIQLIERLLKQD